MLIWIGILTFKLSKITKRFNIFSKGAKVSNLEDIIQEYTLDLVEIKKITADNSIKINDNANRISNLKGNVEVVRYNAFGEEGQDLSFSIAIVDDKQNGLVISSIYNRGVSSIYAKPLKLGKSEYKLSEEELNVLEKINRKN